MIEWASIGPGAVALLAMLVLSLAAALLLPIRGRVPIQWGLRGRPTWTAPVWFSVIFIPGLALIITGFTFAFSPNKARFVADNVLPLLLIIHAVYLLLAGRGPRR